MKTKTENNAVEETVTVNTKTRRLIRLEPEIENLDKVFVYPGEKIPMKIWATYDTGEIEDISEYTTDLYPNYTLNCLNCTFADGIITVNKDTEIGSRVRMECTYYGKQIMGLPYVCENYINGLKLDLQYSYDDPDFCTIKAYIDYANPDFKDINLTPISFLVYKNDLGGGNHHLTYRDCKAISFRKGTTYGNVSVSYPNDGTLRTENGSKEEIFTTSVEVYYDESVGAVDDNIGERGFYTTK